LYTKTLLKKTDTQSQWSSDSNRKRKAQGSFLDAEFSSSASYNVYGEVLQKQPAVPPNAPSPNTASLGSGGSALPSDMRERFEKRSGYSLADMRIFYNSDEPAKLGALAYARGNVVHLGPGQEQHLPHEIGHVIQQKAGLVRPTGTINGVSVNTDPSLEQKATQINNQPIQTTQLTKGITSVSPVTQLNGVNVRIRVIYGQTNYEVGPFMPGNRNLPLGRSHAERIAWEEVAGANGNRLRNMYAHVDRVTFIFTVEGDLVCGYCRDWLNDTVRPQLMQICGDLNRERNRRVSFKVTVYEPRPNRSSRNRFGFSGSVPPL